METKLIIEKVRDVKTPSYGTSNSAGIDFFIPEDFPVTTVAPHHDIMIKSGIKLEIPEGMFLKMANKSSRAITEIAFYKATEKSKTMAAGMIAGADVIDSDYKEEISLHLINYSEQSIILRPGDKIIQGILLPYIKGEIEEGKVGEPKERKGGFGSTGDR